METTPPSSPSRTNAAKSSNSGSPKKKAMRMHSPRSLDQDGNTDEDDRLLRQAEKQRTPPRTPQTGKDDFLRGGGDSNIEVDVSVRRGTLFGDDTGKALPSPASCATEKGTNRTTVQRKTGDALWKRELRTLFRQKWSWKQKKAIMRAMLRLRKTTGTHSAIVFIPETYNASTYATSGDFADVIRAWSAGLAGMRQRKEAKLHISVTELLQRFDPTSSYCRIASFDSILSACEPFCPLDVLTKARCALEVELALDTSCEFKPESTQFALHIRTAIDAYVKASAFAV